VFAADDHRVHRQERRELLADDTPACLALRQAEHAVRS
jgi:hypothetical protein